jgi:hypothetical protein
MQSLLLRAGTDLSGLGVSARSVVLSKLPLAGWLLMRLREMLDNWFWTAVALLSEGAILLTVTILISRAIGLPADVSLLSTRGDLADSRILSVFSLLGILMRLCREDIAIWPAGIVFVGILTACTHRIFFLSSLLPGS